MSVVFCAVTAAIVAAVAITTSDATTSLRLGAISWIGAVDFELVLVYVVGMWVMQVAIMQIVNVVIVLDCSVVAIFAVSVGMITVGIAAHVCAPKVFRIIDCSAVRAL